MPLESTVERGRSFLETPDIILENYEFQQKHCISMNDLCMAGFDYISELLAFLIVNMQMISSGRNLDPLLLPQC